MSAATEHLRLTILRMLAGAQGYSANSSMIHSVTTEFGIGATRDQIRTELAWLAEQGLISTKDVATVVVARITDRGLDVADGRAIQPGVQRPSPGG
ncbi:MAG TPA: hypothetical protein VMU59_14325 [Caulobacteraceae bacterium]|nr:hypothetical protein [Caulobacteraceae bacterium]